jgi:CheY-like chemotaxis protein
MTKSLTHPLMSKLLWCGGALLLASPLWLTSAGAQPPMGGADPFAEGAADPAPAAPKKGAAADQAELSRVEPEVILQLRDSNPQTPKAILQAASAVFNFGRPDEAKRYLAKFIAAKFPENDLVALPAELGTDFFLILNTNKDLQPEGQQVSAVVLAAARKFAEDPARLEALIKSLSDASYEAASSALVRLDQAGPVIVGPMLQALADPNRAGEHPRLYSALVDLQSTTEAPLIGTLAAAPEPMQVAAANALGRMGSRTAVRHLLAHAWASDASPALRDAAREALTRIMDGVPSQGDSELYLQRQLKHINEGQHPFQPNVDNRTLVWQWDNVKKAPSSTMLPLEDAIRQLSARLANDLHRLDPSRTDFQKQRLLYYLDFSQAMNGLFRPLPETNPAYVAAKEAGPEVTAAVLAMAMEEKLHGAAIAAAQILGEIGTPALLQGDNAMLTPLATALKHADSRVRLAAALAIVRLNPDTSFPGASHVIEVLSDAVRTAGVDRVLVVDARPEYAQTIVGFLADLGYVGETATSSREAFRMATTGPDYELVLISDALDLPPTEMVQLLRRDRRTALLPIGVFMGADRIEELPQRLHDTSYLDPVGKIRSQSVDSVAVLLARDPRTLVVPRPVTSESTSFITNQVRKRGGRDLSSREERIQRGVAALAALETLAANDSTLNRYGVLRGEPALIAALSNPALTPAAAQVLGILGTPKAQTALVDTASQLGRAIADRQAASTGFQAAVKKRGILLTKAQIIAQYDRYNASETLDPDTQAVLGSVLDVLESRRAASSP